MDYEPEARRKHCDTGNPVTAVVEMRSPGGIRPRLLAGLHDGPTDLVGHELTFGPLPLDQRPRQLIDTVERSGLVGQRISITAVIG